MNLRSLLLTSLLTFTVSAAHAVLIPGKIQFISEGNGNGKPVYVIKITGPIAYPMDEEFLEATKQMTDPQRPLWIDLDSPGGSSDRGDTIIKVIRNEIAKGREIVTTVENGHTCASMCVPIYVQGQIRWAGEGTLFMFHGATQQGVSNIPNAARTREVMQYFYDAGVDATWMQSLIDSGVFSTPGAYWTTGKALHEEKTKIITHLFSGHVKEEPYQAPFDPNIRPR